MIKKALLLLLFILPLITEAAHITDRLLAGMYSSADVSSDPIKLLPSGTPLEVLTEEKGFVKIQLVDGKEGWVEKRFLSANKPAKVRLLVLQGKYKELQAEFDEANKELDKLKTNPVVDVEKERFIAMQQELSELKKKPQQLEIGQIDEEQSADQPSVSAGLSSIWLLVLPLVFMPLGLYAGILLQDKRQRAKHGGFRV